MKKWEIQNSRKNHLQKILQAKPTLKPFAKKRPTTATVRELLRKESDYPLFKILKAIGLQQYARGLIERGFGDDIIRLQLLKQTELLQLLDELKVAPGHKVKFYSLIDYIRTVAQSSLASEIIQKKSPRVPSVKSTRKPVTATTSFRKQPPLHTVSSTRSITLKKDQAPPTRKEHFCDKRNRLYQSRDDLQIITKVIKGKFNVATNTRAKRIQGRLALLQPDVDSLLCVKQIREMYHSLDGGCLSSTIINIDIEEICRQLAAILRPMISPSLQAVKFPKLEEDVLNQQDYLDQGSLSDQDSQLNQEKNSLGLRLQLRNQSSHSSIGQQDSCAELPYVQPRHQELPYVQPNVQPNSKISYSDSDAEVLQTDRQNKLLKQFLEDQFKNNEQINSLIRESCLKAKGNSIHNLDQVFPEEECQSEEEESQLIDSCVPSSEDSPYQKQIIFNKVFRSDDPIYNSEPQTETVYNFIKNIVSSSKMEKQAPVMAFIYIKRLLVASGATLSYNSWRNVLFIAMVIASKIWDDQSFQNDCFSKVFNNYTTLQINRLQRVFIQFLQYKLLATAQQFAQAYFELRQEADPKHRCYSLRSLDLKTVLRLQQGGNRLENISKEKYKKLLDKSF